MALRPACAAALAVAVAALPVIGGCAAAGGPRVGAAAPAFTAVDARGQTVSLETFKGAVVILDFWALW